MAREILSVLACSFVMDPSSSSFAFGHVYTGLRLVRYFSKMASLDFPLLQDLIIFNDPVLIDVPIFVSLHSPVNLPVAWERPFLRLITLSFAIWFGCIIPVVVHGPILQKGWHQHLLETLMCLWHSDEGLVARAYPHISKKFWHAISNSLSYSTVIRLQSNSQTITGWSCFIQHQQMMHNFICL